VNNRRELLCDAIFLQRVASKHTLLVAFFLFCFLSLLHSCWCVCVCDTERNKFSLAFVEMVECSFYLPIIMFVVVVVVVIVYF